MGVPTQRLDMLPYCCDLDRYREVPATEIESVRERHCLSGQTVFLFSGQMIDRKGVDTALDAFASIANERRDIALILLGNGPLRSQYEASVPQSLRSQVHFVGHVPQSELPAYFLAADVFVFPSRHDGWGVVVNEACAARLPVITTRQTGAAYDLVIDGQNGFILDCDDMAGFASAMQHFLDHPEDRATFGKRSRERVELFSPSIGAERFLASVSKATQL
ncbi:MAG: glycosyltransferase family 4 protein [Planctomycetaceae bacterium]|nr:glycosyltransferase family 4 protein [Planctomycetaceae bacterium]